MQLRRSIALKAHPDKVPDFKLRGDQYYAFMSGGVAVQNAVLDLSTRDYQVMFYEPSYCRSFAIPFFCVVTAFTEVGSCSCSQAQA